MVLRRRDALALATLAYTAVSIAVVGVSRWILVVWALCAGVLLVLGVLGYLLQREFRAQAPGPGGNRLVWSAAGVAAFVSCTLAAGLVRRHGEESLVPLFVLLGGLMVLAVVLARLAYHRDPSQAQETDRNA